MANLPIGVVTCWIFSFLPTTYAPQSVITHTPRPSNDGHSSHNLSTLTFPGGGDRFARENFVVHYNDSGLLPSFSALGLPHKSGPIIR